MPRRSDAEMFAIKTQWEKLMATPEFRQLSQEEQGKYLDISGMTIGRWIKDLGPGEWETFLKEDNKYLAQKEIKVDDSVYKAALAGDVSAAKLWYQKKKGWSERQISENINKNGDFEGMSDDELLAGFNKEALEKALKAKELRVVDPKTENG